MTTVSQLGDARTGKLADNLSGFGRTLRRAGVRVDAARMALAQQAVMLVGLRRDDFCAALEAVLVSREQDRLVFRELFDAYFRNPDVAQKLLAQMLPSAESRAEPARRRPRVSEALAPVRAARNAPPREDDKVDFDAAMTASDLQRLRQADFNQLSASEYLLVERLARDIALPLPRYAARRTRPGVRGSRPHWPGAMHHAARNGGEVLRIPLLQRRQQPLPLLVLVDVSGSMERYARLLLAFLHAATAPRHTGAALRRDVFAFGTGLTDLTPAFRLADMDAVRLQRLRQVRPVVDDERRAGAQHDGHENAAGGEDGVVRHILQPQLDAGDIAALQRVLQDRGEHRRVKRRRRDEVEPAAVFVAHSAAAARTSPNLALSSPLA